MNRFIPHSSRSLMAAERGGIKLGRMDQNLLLLTLPVLELQNPITRYIDSIMIQCHKVGVSFDP